MPVPIDNYKINHIMLTPMSYRIMQIVRGGKLSRLHDLLLFAGKLAQLYSNSKHLIIERKNRWKTFAIRGLSAKTAKVFYRERFALYGNMHKHSALLFPVVIVFVCEILTAPATVICLTSCNII